MNLLDLEYAVKAVKDSVIEDGNNPKDIDVSLQIELKKNNLTVWTSDIDLHYDNYCNVSGCVILGYGE